MPLLQWACLPWVSFHRDVPHSELKNGQPPQSHEWGEESEHRLHLARKLNHEAGRLEGMGTHVTDERVHGAKSDQSRSTGLRMQAVVGTFRCTLWLRATGEGDRIAKNKTLAPKLRSMASGRQFGIPEVSEGVLSAGQQRPNAGKKACSGERG